MKHTKNVLKENHAETREPPPGTLIQGPTTAIHVFTIWDIGEFSIPNTAISMDEGSGAGC